MPAWAQTVSMTSVSEIGGSTAFGVERPKQPSGVALKQLFCCRVRAWREHNFSPKYVVALLIKFETMLDLTLKSV